MSRTVAVYVGPFATWPEECIPADGPDGATLANLGYFYGESAGPGSAAGSGVRAAFYTPDPYNPPRPGGPAHTLYYDNQPPGECVGADYRRLDREAEVEAFRTAYAAELARIAQLAGREPVLGWGVIFSYG